MVRKLRALNFQRMASILPSLCKLMLDFLPRCTWGLANAPTKLRYINKSDARAPPWQKCQSESLFHIYLLVIYSAQKINASYIRDLLEECEMDREEINGQVLGDPGARGGFWLGPITSSPFPRAWSVS